jgi:transcriptional regulator with XRE-family HTH domain
MSIYSAHPFIQRLRAERRARGIKQEVLAAQLNVGHSTLSHWEVGDKEPAKLVVLERWARMLGCELRLEVPPK